MFLAAVHTVAALLTTCSILMQNCPIGAIIDDLALVGELLLRDRFFGEQLPVVEERLDICLSVLERLLVLFRESFSEGVWCSRFRW